MLTFCVLLFSTQKVMFYKQNRTQKGSNFLPLHYYINFGFLCPTYHYTESRIL